MYRLMLGCTTVKDMTFKEGMNQVKNRRWEVDIGLQVEYMYI